MNKNALYSIFLHLAVIISLYFAVDLKDFEDDATKVTISFDSNPEAAIKAQEPVIEPEKEIIEPKKEEPKTPPKEIKKSAEKIIEKSKEKPKEIIKKEAGKKEEIKKPLEKIKDEIKPQKEDIKAPQAPKLKEDKKAKEEKAEEKTQENLVKIAATKAAPAVENTIEKLNLSAREKFNIQSQLKRCYKKAIAENKGTSEILIMVKVAISKDGYLKSNLDEIIDYDLYKSPQGIAYKTAIDNARSAIKFCNPLRNLPADKFDTWKDITLQFDGKND